MCVKYVVTQQEILSGPFKTVNPPLQNKLCSISSEK